MKRVAVTGIGMVDTCGNHISTCFDNLLNDKDFHRPLSDFFTEDELQLRSLRKVKNALGVDYNNLMIDDGHSKFVRFMPNSMKIGIHAVDQALRDAQVDITENVGVFLSTLLHNDEEYNFIINDKIPPLKGVNLPKDSLCGYISQYYGFTGQNMGFQAACATGLATIDYAMKVIDDYDYVIAGGADAGITVLDIGMFSSLRALGDISMPYDKDRTGFVMGEGAGVFILESEKNAKKRGAHIHAWLYPAGHASDAFNRTAPSGVGAVASMEKALDNAFLPEVDYVNSHGTSTPAGDGVEFDAIRKITDAPITSNKGKIGHTFAAAGVIEAAYSIESMNRGIIPHCHNTANAEYDVVLEPIETNVSCVMNNSFGFGGKCISQIIEKS